MIYQMCHIPLALIISLGPMPGSKGPTPAESGASSRGSDPDKWERSPRPGNP